MDLPLMNSIIHWYQTNKIEQQEKDVIIENMNRSKWGGSKVNEYSQTGLLIVRKKVHGHSVYVSPGCSLQSTSNVFVYQFILFFALLLTALFGFLTFKRMMIHASLGFHSFLFVRTSYLCHSKFSVFTYFCLANGYLLLLFV